MKKLSQCARTGQLPPSGRIRLAGLLALALLCATSPAQAAETFNRKIRPILSEYCMACHGPDPGSRKAGLRFDTEDGLLGTGRRGGPVVIPGDPDKSPLWQRIVTEDPDDIMPPPEAHKELSESEKNLLRSWIEEGAAWEPHWAFIPVERPPLPEIPAGLDPAPVIRNPIDAFVAKKLAERGLTMNPQADRRTLARRLSLDLTGLPPTPDLVNSFVQDTSPDYYERFVRQLMTSPQWGEHRGRYWLDSARYADTHGLHFDNYREMWPYRDWVVNAFNRNQPFNEFVLEQIAGDLLPDPTQEQLIATGFQRCNITTNEGGTIEEENLSIYATDRVSTTGWVLLGLTMNCAECHDHKFDPISTKDFYAMAAFYRNTEQPGLDGNVKDSRPAITVVLDPEERARWKALPEEINRAKAAIEERRESAKPAFDAWLASISPEDASDPVSDEALEFHALLNEGEGDSVSVRLKDGTQGSLTAGGPIQWVPDGKLGPAPEIRAQSVLALDTVGDFEKDTAFSYGGWVRVPTGGRYEAVLARMDQDTDFRGWDLFTHDRNLAVHMIHTWPNNALKVVTTENPIQLGQWAHVWVNYSGSGKAGGVQIFVNGEPAKTRVEVDKLDATIRTQVPLTLGQRSRDQRLTGGAIQDVRIYRRELQAGEVRALALDAPPRILLAVAADKPTEAHQKSLYRHYLEQVDSEFEVRSQHLAALETEQKAIRERNPVTHIQREKSDSKPMTPIKIRGQYDNPGEMVAADVPEALPPMDPDLPRNRLGLAHWLIDPGNPLTARVTVNRFWQELFGVGLVETAEDFGVMGEIPEHQDLLDWLAAEFVASGWDVQHLFRLMVSSSTYRQSQTVTEEKLALDPSNRLLSRGPRFRLDAEMIRDYALSVSGLLVPTLGGPSVKPYHPDGVWEAVAMPESNTRRYQQETGSALYRRSLYTFWKRAAPPASMEIFDAPSREVSCNRRERTNTPLQALTTLNDVQFVEAARHLATRALKAADQDFDGAIDWMAARTLSRALKPLERSIVRQTWVQMLAHYENAPADAEELIQFGDSKPAEDLPAALLATATLVANQLLNLDEVLNK